MFVKNRPVLIDFGIRRYGELGYPTFTPRYLDRFLGLSCLPDGLLEVMKGSSKEITESMSMVEFFRHEHKSPMDFYVIGDGARPRTGMLAAFLTKWNCISVDPQMRLEYTGRVQRLTVLQCTDIELQIAPMNENCIVVYPHSHATPSTMLKVWRKHYKTVQILCLPCCVDHLKGMPEPSNSFGDPGVLSPHRIVHYWDNDTLEEA